MGFLHDVRFGLRMLGKSPGFTIVAVLTLAMGIGVNSVVFTIVNAVLINGLPFHDPEEIVGVQTNRGMSYLDYIDYKQQSRSFKGISAFSPFPADLSDQKSDAERVNGASISADTFSTLGQKPLIGRDLTAADEKPGAVRVALISYFLWQARYGGKPDVPGRAIRVNLQTYTIAGVMPEGEAFPQDTRIWLPLIPDEDHQKRDQRNIDLVARLNTGVSLTQARTELRTISSRLAQAYPDTNKDVEATVFAYTDRNTRGPVRTVLYSMQGAVGFVLLIACANVANLLLSRAAGRARETSIRTALGASRWRIVRQLLVESVMMSFLAGILGLALAHFGVKWFNAELFDTGKPYWIVFAMDYRVFAHFLAVCVLTGILFGLAPALHISRTNTNESLKEGGRGTSAGLKARRTTAILLVGEIALTIVLLAGAGLMIRSFLNSEKLDVGVDTSRMQTVQIQPSRARYPGASDRLAFEEQLMQRLAALPGMELAVVASHPPAGGAAMRTLKIEGRDMADKNDRLPITGRIAVLPGYFQALNLRLLRGREFTPTDGGTGSEAAIVNETFVRKYFPNEDPLGKRIRIGQDLSRRRDDLTAPWATIVGVSPAVFQQTGGNNDLTVQPVVYLPFRQDPPLVFTVIARGRLPQDAIIASIRHELKTIDPDLPLYNIRSLDDILREQTWPYMVFGALFALFGFIALLISGVGIYSITAHGVGQRTQEIGVRIALGASRQNVVWLVVKQGLVRIVIGLTFGLLAAFGTSRLIASLLINVTPTDPVTFASISILLVTVTALACFIPARRATRLNPVDALRSE
jgi:predicted permease